MKKHYIILVNALALTGASLIAMEGNPHDNSTVAVVSADTLPDGLLPLCKDEIAKIDFMVSKLGKKTPFNPSEPLSSDEKNSVVEYFLRVDTLLKISDQNDQEAVGFHFQREQLYNLALALYGSKEAAKQFLKQADYLTDEEKEDPRKDYHLAKHSSSIKEKRKKELTLLDGDLKKLEDARRNKLDLIGKLRKQIAKEEQDLVSNSLDQFKITTDLEATQRTIQNANTIIKAKLEKLIALFTSHHEQITALKAELHALNESKETLESDKIARTANMAAKNKQLAELEIAKVSVKRDIDLIRNEYSFVKKFCWKIPGLFSLYPAETSVKASTIATLAVNTAVEKTLIEDASLTDEVSHEEDKEKRD